MKPVRILLLLMLTLVVACSEKDLRDAVRYIDESTDLVPLTEEEVSAALKDSLARGISRGSALAARTDGYLGNPRLKIEFPPDTIKVEQTLRKIGFGKELDRFVEQLNRAAEQAAAKAKPIFIREITSMDIRDAFEILNGGPDAATRYLERSTSDELYDAFLPEVQKALDQTSATRYYAELVNRFNQLPLTFNVDPDLDEYATNKAIEGLFKLIADEEAEIRANPAARTTKLFRRVFGSLD